MARLEAGRPEGETLIVTMNVDDLHQRAGSKEVWHMHGELSRARCASCDHRWNAPEVMAPGDICPSCGVAATRPDVVWFGEKSRYLDDLYARRLRAKLFVQIGSSGTVSPANEFVDIARDSGVPTLALNLDPPQNANRFDERRCGNASEIVPKWVEEVLSQQ